MYPYIILKAMTIQNNSDNNKPLDLEKCGTNVQEDIEAIMLKLTNIESSSKAILADSTVCNQLRTIYNSYSSLIKNDNQLRTKFDELQNINRCHPKADLSKK